MVRSAINSVTVDPFLQMLSVVNQEGYISTIPSLNCDQPEFYWIFRNMDFVQWDSANCSQVLWLSGPPKCNIHQVSSYIVKEKALKIEYYILHFFCSTAVGGKSIVSLFVHTLLYQIVSCSPMDKKISIVRNFLHSHADSIFEKDSNQLFDNFPEMWLKRILDAPTDDELWTALKAVLAKELERELFLVVDGLDKVQYEKREFINGVRVFVEHLQQRTAKVKILLTSRPQDEIKEILDGLPCIEYDKERKGLIAPRFLKQNI
jgi:hypothetical protein